MREKAIFSVLLAVLLTGMTACGAAEADISAENAPDSATAEETDTVLSGLSEIAEDEYALAGNYFDLAEYAENDGEIGENMTGCPLSVLTVDGTDFTIGMGYDEVLSLGYEPDSEAFGGTKPNGVSVSCGFSDGAGSTLELGFASADIRNTSATVRDGGYLFEIAADAGQNSFSIEGISENSTVADIIEIFGYPFRIDAGTYADFPDMQLKYKSAGTESYLTFCVNLETERIVEVHLKGYAE